MKLSACLIVKDEESCIETCLKSIQGVDEIIVIDTGSTDRTIGIVEKYTDICFIDYSWNDDFAEARNHALSKATGDWILTIDADEYLEEGGVDKCRREIALIKDEQKTINCTCTSTKGEQIHYQPRLYRRHPDIFWKGAIHNYLSVVETNRSDIIIYYGYSEAHKKDPNRALRILNKVLKANPDAVREKFYLAREHWYRQAYHRAIHWYLLYLKTSTWTPERVEAMLMLARCSSAIGDHRGAMEWCSRAIYINTNFEEAILFMASISGPKNRKRWAEFAKTATNEDVLFYRV